MIGLSGINFGISIIPIMIGILCVIIWRIRKKYLLYNHKKNMEINNAKIAEDKKLKQALKQQRSSTLQPIEEKD